MNDGKRLCKYCDVVSDWLFLKKRTRANGSTVNVYTDKTGSVWDAARCPICQKQRINKRAKRKRRIEKSEIYGAKKTRELENY